MTRNDSSTITLQPREKWVVDQQCIILLKGYLADWAGYERGDVFENNSDTEQTFEIDYGGRPTA